MKTIEDIVKWLETEIEDNAAKEELAGGGFSAMAYYAVKSKCQELLEFINSGDEK